MASSFSTWATDHEEEGHEFSGNNVESKGDDRDSSLRELEQELKLLQWHKLANESALKAALIKTKRLKHNESRQNGAMRASEKSAWMHKVIQEEQVKQLAVSPDYVNSFKAKESRIDRRVEQDMKVHVRNINKIKGDIQKRQETRERNEQYREKKKLLDDQARAVSKASMKNRPSNGFSFTSSDITTIKNSDANEDDNMKAFSALDRLVELEKRITLLERDDVPTAKGDSNQVSFEKTRTNIRGKAPSQTKYHVRVQSKQPSRNAASSSSRFGTKSQALTTTTPAATTGRNRVRDRITTARKQDEVVSKWLHNRPKAGAGPGARTGTNRRVAAPAPAAKDRMREFNDVRKQFDKRKQTLQSNPKSKYAPASSSTKKPLARSRLSAAQPAARTRTTRETRMGGDKSLALTSSKNNNSIARNKGIVVRDNRGGGGAGARGRMSTNSKSTAVTIPRKRVTTSVSSKYAPTRKSAVRDGGKSSSSNVNQSKNSGSGFGIVGNNSLHLPRIR